MVESISIDHKPYQFLLHSFQWEKSVGKLPALI